MKHTTTHRATAALLLSGLTLGIAGVARADAGAQIIHPLFLDQPGTLALPKWGARPADFVASVQESGTEGCNGQCFLLNAGAGPAEAREEFRSATGRFVMFLADFDGDHMEEIVMVLGQQQESGALQDKLVVLAVRPGKLEPLFETPVVEYYGGEARWRYAVTFQTEPAGQGSRTVIDLALANDRANAGGMAAKHDVVMRKQHLRYALDPGTKQFVEVRD